MSLPVCMICKLVRASHSDEGFCPIISTTGERLGYSSLSAFKVCEHPRRERRMGAPWFNRADMKFFRWTSTCVVCGHRRRFSKPEAWRPEGWAVAA